MASAILNCLAPVQLFFADVSSSVEERLDLLAREMSELKGKKDEVMMNIDVAEQQGRRPSHEATNWLQRVEEVLEAADKIKDEFDNRVHCLGDISLRYQLNKRAMEKIQDARELKNRSFTQTTIESVPERPGKRPGGSLVGMDSEMQQLQDYVNDDKVRTIGIYGMGGVGKTSLMEEFNNNHLSRDVYELVFWINMEDRPSVVETQKAVGKKLGLPLQDKWTAEERAIHIFNHLGRKKFVLVLDNVWKPIDLGLVGIPIGTGQPKSKIIVITRKEDVCNSMDAEKIRVNVLNEEAWTLFVEKTGKEELINSNPMIRRQAKILVNQCGGLPLALVTIGRAMATKSTPQQWKHVIRALEAAPAQVPCFEEDVLSRLKLSCDDLADDKLMTVLMYCAIYQSNALAHKEALIDYSIGEGIIEGSFDDGKEIYDKGHDLFGVLRAASLLENYYLNDDYMFMHPMVRIMALWIGCECGKEKRWLIQVGRGLKVAPDIRRWRGVERISFSCNNIKELSEIPDCPTLLTLCLYSNSQLAKLPDGFFVSMRNLKVLDLSWTTITELPAGIDILVSLQYFDVCHTPIRSLPQELGALVMLKFVLLNGTPYLETIPDGAIRNFSQLLVLRMEDSYANWKVGSVGDGVDFEELNCLKRLTTLEITVESQSALEKLAASHRLAASTRRLYIKGCPSLVTLSASTLMSDMKNLQKLQICDSSDLEEFVIDNSTGGDNTLPNLETFQLTDLRKAKLTWNQGCLQNLCKLRIYRCAAIEQVIYSKHELDDEKEGFVEINIFPSLKTLDLQHLPELKSLYSGPGMLAFPSLELLWVNNCPKLDILGLNAEKLKRVHGPKSWWDGQDETIKSKLLPFYTENHGN